jgi:hypothetical protein
MWLTTTRKRSIERILNEAGDSLLWAYAAAFWGCAIFGWPVHDVRLGVTIGPLILFVYRVALLIADKKNPKAFAYHIISTSIYLIGWYFSAEVLLNLPL